jgi:prepilin-type N-terminal cleavage/methylation domain-containing protein
MKRFWQKEKGFTLIELLIVVAIIGIVAGIAIPRFLGARTVAKVTRAFADMRTIADGLEMYFTAENKYPTALTDADLATYITSVPKDPFDADDGPYRYYVNDDTTPIAWLIVSNGPDLEEDVTDETEGFSWAVADLVAGEVGGSNGSSTGYGLTVADGDWSVAKSANDDGDIGRGGP